MIVDSVFSILFMNPRSKKVKKGPKFDQKEALKKQLDKRRNTKNLYYNKPPDFNELALLFPSFEKQYSQSIAWKVST